MTMIGSAWVNGYPVRITTWEQARSEPVVLREGYWEVRLPHFTSLGDVRDAMRLIYSNPFVPDIAMDDEFNVSVSEAFAACREGKHDDH